MMFLKRKTFHKLIIVSHYFQIFPQRSEKEKHREMLVHVALTRPGLGLSVQEHSIGSLS